MANLVRLDPFREVEDLFRRFSPLLGRGPNRPMSSADQDMEWSPASDIIQSDREYLIKATLPEVKREDIKITLEDGVLTISGERRKEREAKGENELRVESYYGTFMRSFALPDDADAGNIKAESRDGVLNIHVPRTKSQKSKALQIPVQ